MVDSGRNPSLMDLVHQNVNFFINLPLLLTLPLPLTQRLALDEAGYPSQRMISFLTGQLGMLLLLWSLVSYHKVTPSPFLTTIKCRNTRHHGQDTHYPLWSGYTLPYGQDRHSPSWSGYTLHHGQDTLNCGQNRHTPS